MECQSNTEPANNQEEDDILKQIIRRKQNQYRVEIRNKQNKQMQEKKRLKCIQDKQLQQQYLVIEVDEDITKLECQKEINAFNDQYTQQNYDGIVKAIGKLRIILTNEYYEKCIDQNIKLVQESGIINLIISFLDKSFAQYLSIQRDVLWIISHIFAYDSSSVEACVQQGIADTLLEFFGSPEVQLREMSVLAVSNMCGDSAKIRRFLIKKKNLIQVITDVLIKMPSQGSSELMDNLASLIRNIFGKDNLKPEAYYPLLLIMQQMLLPKHVTKQIGTYLLLGLCEYIETYAPDDNALNEITGTHIILFQRMMEWMRQIRKDTSPETLNALKCGLCILNVLCGGYDETAEKLLQIGVLELLLKITKHQDEKARFHAVCVLKNICACESDILAYLFEHSLVLIELQRLIEQDTFLIKKAALIAVANICISADSEQIVSMIELGLLKLLTVSLVYQDNELIIKLLEGIQALLREGECIKQKKGLFSNPYSIRFRSENGDTYLNNILENHKNPDIIKLANEIWSEFTDFLLYNQILNE